jgi:type II secretory pathway component GspD/PulD (secretin)
VARSLEVRGADTLVRVREGETIVIDGLMQAATRREPAQARGLAAVPVLGRLFGRHAKPATARKTELVILLTPTIG